MLVLESQEFDLNTLFSFDSLKLILIKLAKSQKILEDEVKAMHNILYQNDKINANINNDVIENNNIRQNDVINIKEDKIEKKEENNDKINFSEKELNNYYKNNIFEKEKTNNINIIDDNGKNKPEKNDNIENIVEKNYNQDNNNNNNNKNLFINKINDINLKYFPNIEQNIPSKKTSNELNINTDRNELSNINNNQQLIIKESDIKKEEESSNTNISPDFSKLIKEQKELRARINSLEIKLGSKEAQIHNIENKIKNNSLENEIKLKKIHERIDELNKKDENMNEKIEKLEVKTSDLDIFAMFKDNGDGNIDATKLLVKSLEEKVFKKLYLIDEKYKKDAANNIKLKTNIEIILPKIDQINRDIERIHEINKQYTEEVNILKENEQKINDNNNEIYEDINKKIQEIKSELDKKIKSKISSMENNINNIIKKSNENNGLDFLKLSLGNTVEPEKIDMLNKKIVDLRTKMNDIENTLKLYINSNEIDSIKNDIKDFRLLLDKKITKDDLKELYNFHLSTMDEITDIKDRESITHDDLEKIMKDLQNLQQRVESLNGYISLIQNTPNNEAPKIIDLSKYIDNKKFSDTLKPILKEFEKINKEIESLRRDLTDTSTKNSSSIKSAINLIEDDTNNKINDLKINIQKKYLEKFEYHKGIKSLEVQIKSNIEEKKKLDADSWLLAKKPINCFNCASCEAKIKNDEYVPTDYLAWKKYPRGEKIHRMGQGFSHMLQMMTSEFIKNVEKNEVGTDYESSSRNINKNNLSTSPSFQPSEKQNINLMLLNSKDKERDDSISFKKKTKFTLPKMSQTSKNKIKLIDGDNLPVSDEDNNDVVISDNNIAKESEIVSPKILKITKKTKANFFDMSKNKGIFKNLTIAQGTFTPREKNKDLE